MDYLTLFRPLLAVAAPAAAAAARGAPHAGVWREVDARAVAILAERPVAEGHAAEFDAAWLPLAAWLDEGFAALRSDADRRAWLDCCGFADRDPHAEFAAGLAAAPERPAVAAVYSLCLGLGYRGRLGDAERERGRLACRAALPPVSLLQASPPAAPARSRPALPRHAWWAVPAAVTVGLFFLYRSLLADLLDQTLGL